ncbi:MAG TPA: rhomboid family intramembrane serine protease [Firmicutes bacterium]|nr:rhomboid family intramembrane serine protease [Bacillota bacterium]
MTNIALYACLGNSWTSAFGNGSVRWERSFDFQRIWRCFLNNFSHGTWQHALLNMLCFFIAGLYLERKTGSLGLLGLVLSLAVLQGCVCAAAKGDLGFYGFSGVNYALYAYIAIDYLFSFTKSRRNKTDLIFGGIVLALIYLAMCFSGGTATVSFKPYPYDLLHNLGHGTGFFCGAIVALLVQLPMAAARHSAKESALAGRS